MGQTDSLPALEGTAHPLDTTLGSAVQLPPDRADSAMLLEHVGNVIVNAPEHSRELLENYYRRLYELLPPNEVKISPEDESDRWAELATLYNALISAQEPVDVTRVDKDEKIKPVRECHRMPLLAMDGSNVKLLSMEPLMRSRIGVLLPIQVEGCRVVGKVARHPSDFHTLLDEGLSHAAMTSPLVLEAMEQKAMEMNVEPWDVNPVVPIVGIVRTNIDGGPMLVLRRVEHTLRTALELEEFMGNDLIDVLLQVFERLAVMRETIGFMHRSLTYDSIALVSRPRPVIIPHSLGGHSDSSPGLVLTSRWIVRILDVSTACATLDACRDCAYPPRINAGMSSKGFKVAAPFCRNPTFDVLTLANSLAANLPARLREHNPVIKRLFRDYFEAADQKDPVLEKTHSSEWTPESTHSLVCELFRITNYRNGDAIVSEMAKEGTTWLEDAVGIQKLYVAALSRHSEAGSSIAAGNATGDKEGLKALLLEAESGEEEAKQLLTELEEIMERKLPARKRYVKMLPNHSSFWTRSVPGAQADHIRRLRIQESSLRKTRNRLESERQAVKKSMKMAM
jgi:hypothetical protein